jgi:hypothetical protein
MTLRLIEGFDFMPTGLSTSERERLYSAKGYYPIGNGMDVGVGRFGFGKAMRTPYGVTGGGMVSNRIPIGGALNEGFAGVAVYVGAGSTNQTRSFVSFYDGLADSAQCSVVFAPNGIVQVTQGGPTGTVLVSSATGSYQADQWLYPEFHPIIGTSSGGMEVRVNTKPVISLVSANTQAIGARATFDMINVGWESSGTIQFVDYGFDDLYLCDTAGSANNGFLGNCRVKTQFVTGNSTPQDFAIGGTSPAATAWQSLLNTALDNTKYIHSGTVGDESLFTIETIINAPMVFGIQVSGAYWQDDATQRIVRNLIKSGATLTEGVDQYTNQTPTFYKDLLEINPAAGVGYTGADLNALLIGGKVEA